MQARVLIGDGERHQEGRIAAPPGQPHGAGQRLHEVVLSGPRYVGARATVTRRRGVDQARIAFAERVVTEAETIHHAGPEVFDHDVRAVGEFEHALQVAGISQVDCDAALVAIEREKGVGFAVRSRSEDAPLAHPFAFLLLELDDVGAEVGKDLRRERALQQRRKVQNADSVEWPRASRLLGHLNSSGFASAPGSGAVIGPNPEAGIRPIFRTRQGSRARTSCRSICRHGSARPRGAGTPGAP